MYDDVYQLYLDELKNIEPCELPEMDALLVAISQGNLSAKNRLLEGCLGRVLELAAGYDNQGVALTDLIQEANIVLTCMVNECEKAKEAIDGDSFWRSVEQEITDVLSQLLQEQKEFNQQEEEMVAKVNVLEIVSQKLAKDFGRQATITELSETMKMTEEEILEILKWTLDAVNINE